MTKPDAVKAQDKLIGKALTVINKVSDSNFSYIVIASIPTEFYWRTKVFFEYDEVTRFLEE